MTAIETLISVLCGPDGKCCISGSDDDRRLIDSTLAELTQAAAAPAGDWLWVKLMDFCKKRGFAPANFNDLFEIVDAARAARTPVDSVLEDAARWNAWSQAMIVGANSYTEPEFLRVLSDAIGDAELPITLQQLNAWVDVARTTQKE